MKNPTHLCPSCPSLEARKRQPFIRYSKKGKPRERINARWFCNYYEELMSGFKKECYGYNRERKQ